MVKHHNTCGLASHAMPTPVCCSNTKQREGHMTDSHAEHSYHITEELSHRCGICGCNLSFASFTCQRRHCGVTQQQSIPIMPGSAKTQQRRAADMGGHGAVYAQHHSGTAVLSSRRLDPNQVKGIYLSIRSDALLVEGHRHYDSGVGHSLTQRLALGGVKEANHCT